MEEIRLSYFPTKNQELLLKASLFQGEEARKAFNQWNQRVDIDSVDHGSVRLFPLLLRNLKSQNIDFKHFGILQGISRRTTYQNLFHFRYLAEAVNALQDQAIDVLILKGAALFSLGLYKIDMRPMDDVDLLIKPEKLHQAAEVLSNLGWKSSIESLDAVKKTRHAIQFVNNAGFHLDLHWKILPQFWSSQSQESFWEKSIPTTLNEVNTRTLNHSDLLLHVCVHGARWNTIPTVRWVSDAMAIIGQQGNQIEWTRIFSQAKEFEIGLPVGDTLSYLKKVFTIHIPEDFLSEIRSLPVTRRMKNEYRVFSSQNVAFDNLAGYWYSYQKGITNPNPVSHLFEFVSYLRTSWKKTNSWAVFLHLATWWMRNLLVRAREILRGLPLLGGLYSIYRKRRFGD